MTRELEEQVARAAAVLREYGAREVYVFGSVTTGKANEFSDVDMAVSGLAPKVFLRAWAKAVQVLSGREMDLINLDRGGLFVEYLKRKGKLQRVA